MNSNQVIAGVAGVIHRSPLPMVTSVIVRSVAQRKPEMKGPKGAMYLGKTIYEKFHLKCIPRKGIYFGTKTCLSHPSAKGRVALLQCMLLRPQLDKRAMVASSQPKAMLVDSVNGTPRVPDRTLNETRSGRKSSKR